MNIGHGHGHAVKYSDFSDILKMPFLEAGAYAPLAPFQNFKTFASLLSHEVQISFTARAG
jgi:hypothetical protein